MLKFHKLLLGLVLLILIVGVSISVRAQGDDGLLILDDPQTSYPLGLHIEYLEDPGGNLTFEDVIGPEFAARFTPNTKKNPNFGLTSSAYWIRFHVRNETNQVYDWLLSFADARMGLIDLYYQPQGITGWKHQQAGRFLPATVREYIHPNFVFPLAIPPSHEGKIYLRLQANVPIRFSLSFWPAELFEQMGHGYFLALGLFYGIMLVMVVYNLMIFLFLKKPSYLYYVLFITVLALNTACIDGVAYVYLSPNWTHKYTLLCTTSLGSIFAALFIRDYLELKERVTWLDRVLIYLAASAGLLLLPFFFNLHTLENLAFLTLVNIPVLIAILAIVGSLIVWRQGLHTARYFLLGWLAFLSNVIIITLSILDLLPSSPVYDVTYNFSIVLMVTFLSLALADQINELRTNAIQAEQEIRKSEERFRATFEQAAVGIANVALDGRFLRMNQKFCDIVGYSQTELHSLTFQNITHPDDLDADLEYVARLNAGLIPTYSMEKRYFTKDGRIVWVNLTVSLLWKENGKPDYAIAVVENITLRKQIELALNESELKYRTLVEMANDAIVVIQGENIKFANTRFSQMAGCALEQLQDTHYSNYLSAEQLPMIAKMYRQREDLETPSIYEALIQRQDGLQLPVEFSASLTTYAGEEAVLVFVRDITERKKLEAELRQYSEHLEELVANRTRELEQSREQLAILNRSSQTINMTGLDREKVFTAIRAACAWLVAADVFAISLIDHATGEIEDIYLTDRDQRLPGSRYPLEGSFIGRVLQDGFSLRADNFQEVPNWPGSRPGVRSGMAVVLRGSKENLGVLTVQSYTPNAYTENDQSILESFAAHASIALENIRHYKQLEKSAVIEERQRLASELHDSVTQLLYSMAMMSSGWEVKASQGQLPNPAGHFHQIEELSLQALKEMRVLLHQLRLPVLVEVGLLKALEDRLEKVERRMQVEAHLHVEGRFPRLSKVVEEDIYFIILEALNNSLRHARANAVNIRIQTNGSQLHVLVEDNGRGYDPSKSSPGMGTDIMRRRAETIGAKLKVDSQTGQGTRIELVVEIEPLERIIKS